MPFKKWAWFYNHIFVTYSPILIFFRYSSIALKKHCAEKHEKHITVCNVCHAVFESHKLNQHKYDVHREKKKTVKSCPHCDEKFEVKNTLKRHMLRVHGDDNGVMYYSCDKCDYKNKSNFELKDHINAMHTKEELYQCTICNFSTYRKKNLRSHIRNIHEKHKPNKCEKCFAAFLTKRELIGHMERKHQKFE